VRQKLIMVGVAIVAFVLVTVVIQLAIDLIT
jgi:hypothetical protein